MRRREFLRMLPAAGAAPVLARAELPKRPCPFHGHLSEVAGIVSVSSAAGRTMAGDWWIEGHQAQLVECHCGDMRRAPVPYRFDVRECTMPCWAAVGHPERGGMPPGIVLPFMVLAGSRMTVHFRGKVSDGGDALGRLKPGVVHWQHSQLAPSTEDISPFALALQWQLP